MAAESQFASQQKPADKRATEDLDEELDRDEAEAQAAAFATAALGRVTSRLGDAASELNSMINGLLEAGNDEEQLRYAEQVLEQIKPLESLLDRIRRHKKQGDAFAATAQATALKSDAETACGRWPVSDSPPPDPPGPKPPTWKTIRDHIKDALTHIWAFISRLITPTTWTLTANMGTGVFGFASAGITVTFGESS